LCTCRCHLYIYVHYPALAQTYPLSLHDALPIFSAQDISYQLPLTPSSPSPPPESQKKCPWRSTGNPAYKTYPAYPPAPPRRACQDRKSTRLNSSHVKISYAVFCLKKKKNTESRE